MYFVVALVLLLALSAQAFNIQSIVNRKIVSNISRGNKITMEYIPDGLTKKQWEEMKRKEAEAMKGKDLGKIGITKFQSRSFEAWQKSGAKNLFPVDPNAPLNEKPYMQRPGGSIDGTDLKQKGLRGVGQGKEMAKNEVDKKYESQSNSGFKLPWTQESLKSFSGKKETPQATTKATTTAKTSPVKSAATKEAPKKEEPPKKGFFGLF